MFPSFVPVRGHACVASKFLSHHPGLRYPRHEWSSLGNMLPPHTTLEVGTRTKSYTAPTILPLDLVLVEKTQPCSRSSLSLGIACMMASRARFATCLEDLRLRNSFGLWSIFCSPRILLGPFVHSQVFFAFVSSCILATHQVLYSLKSRCGNRLKNGDFDRSSDALVLAVRDRSRTGGAAKDGDAAGGGGDSARELVAVVELTIRQPDGSLPFNWPLPIPWRRLVSADSGVLLCRRAPLVADVL